LTNGSENWTLIAKCKSALELIEMCILKSVAGVTLRDQTEVTTSGKS